MLGLNVPVLLVAKLTEPTEVIAPAPDESLTVAVQLDGVLSRTLAGEHETVVVVDLGLTARVNNPLLFK